MEPAGASPDIFMAKEGFMMNKINVGVFFGGCSPEYSVSLSSASGVILNLDSEKYRPVLIGISQDGQWFHYAGPVEKLLSDTWQNPADCVPAVLSPNRGDNCLLLLKESGIERVPLDVAFPVLHGGNGEDGTLQGLLELSGIPIAGCGTWPPRWAWTKTAPTVWSAWRAYGCRSIWWRSPIPPPGAWKISPRKSAIPST